MICTLKSIILRAKTQRCHTDRVEQISRFFRPVAGDDNSPVVVGDTHSVCRVGGLIWSKFEEDECDVVAEPSATLRAPTAPSLRQTIFETIEQIRSRLESVQGVICQQELPDQ